jgi:hypothetical protein
MHVGEAISVMVSFGAPYKMKPVRFSWSGRSIEVKEITYTWKSREGQKDIYHFSISDGATLFELTFDTTSLLWRLESLET